MDRFLVDDIKDYRLVQVRLDHESLKFKSNPEHLLRTNFPGEFLGCWRETSRIKKKLHYHIMYIVNKSHKKTDWNYALKHLLPDAEPSAHAIKFYNSKNFKNGETFAFYIGYAAKCSDPIGTEFQHAEECRSEYERVCKEKGSDEQFKSFVLKRLKEDSTDREIYVAIVDWYQQQATQHNVLIMDQRYWQILSLINPDRHHVKAVAAIQSYQNKFLP